MSKKHSWDELIDPENLSWQFIAASLAIFVFGLVLIAATELGWI